MKTHYAVVGLGALLAFAVLTLWVGGRWALSGVEVGAYGAACALVVAQRGRVPIGAALLAPALMCAWAVIQWAAHWSAVPSATVDAALYWLAAACFVLIGSQVDLHAFLGVALAIGAVVCVAGSIQLFTSPGIVFWLFPSGFDRRVIGPFVSPNNYAAFVELLLPVALARISRARPLSCHPFVSSRAATILLWGRLSTLSTYGRLAIGLPPATDNLPAPMAVGLRLATMWGSQSWLPPAFSRHVRVGTTPAPFKEPPSKGPPRSNSLSRPGRCPPGSTGGLAAGSWPYLLIAAALAATVVASGSRTGAALALIEIVTVLAVQRWNRRALLAFVLLTAAFSLIAGQQFLTARFAQKSDPFAVRREFLQSSLAMFRAQPLHGFGLGTWPSAYPQFAIVDTGETANHAHNEWAQWAAEGGAPALLFMVGLMLWAVRPAVRSIWGIGVLAVFAHSLVDYPFLRLGMAAWIFAFLGALSQGERSPVERSLGERRRSWPVAVLAPVLLLAAWQAGKLGYADVLYRRATLSSVERAAALAPDRADYQFVLAQLDSPRAAAHLKRALAANPYDTRARIGLALEWEAAGDRAAAARQLLEAARYDHQFAPAWALASFYFRGGEAEPFWMWARKSAAMSYGDRRALLDLCFLVSGDAHQVFEKMVASRPGLDLPFLEYLIARHRIPDAAEVAARIARDPAPASRDAVLDYIDAAIDAGETVAAWRVGNQLGRARPLLGNGDFAGPLLNRGFDWRTLDPDGVAVARTEDGGPALSIEFSGREPESCDLLKHALPLEPGASYVMRFDYRTVALTLHTGVSWRLGSAGGAALDASASWKRQEWRFRTTDSAELTLAYRRAPGSTRAEGQLFLRNARIDAAPL